MRSAFVIACVFAMLAGLLVGCSKPEEPKGQKAQELAEEMAKQEKERQEKEKKKYMIKAIDPKVLVEVLPPGTEPFAKHDATSSYDTSGADQTAKAMALYGKEPHQFRIDLIDFANAKKKIDEAYWWTSRSINQTLKSGYEKTGVVQQWYKSYERLNTEKKTSQFLVCAGERFIVSAEGAEEDMEVIKNTVQSIDFKKLANMK